MRALVDLLNERLINDDTKLLSVFVLLVEHSHALADRLVVVDVLYASDEIADVKLLLQLKVENGRLVKQLHISISAVLSDLLVDAIKSSEVVCGHGVSQSLLTRVNNG